MTAVFGSAARVLGTLLVTTALALGPAAPAAAHAEIVSTYPAADATAAEQVRHVAVQFDEAVELVPGALTLATDLGVQVPLDRPRLAAGRTLRANVQDALAPGRYIVGWRIRADDGHVESGTFSFRYAGAAGARAPAERPTGLSPTPASPTEPLWPVIVAAALAALGLGGGGLVVRRGLRALDVPVADPRRSAD